MEKFEAKLAYDPLTKQGFGRVKSMPGRLIGYGTICHIDGFHVVSCSHSDIFISYDTIFISGRYEPNGFRVCTSVFDCIDNVVKRDNILKKFAEGVMEGVY